MIQHRVIQNAELHEVKGAETAINGTVLTANGLGGTTFDRVGVQQLKGSLPTAVPDLQVVTDGDGGFKVSEGTYGQFTTTTSGIFPSITYTTTADFTPKGMYVNGNGVSVINTGLYKLDFNTTIFVSSDESGTSFTYPALINSTTLAVVWEGASGILTLTAGVIYRPSGGNKFTLIGVQ